MGNKPTKVVIEITASGWSERVYSGDVIIAETSHTMVARYSALENDSGDWYSRLDDDCMELAEALEDINLFPFGVAVSLYEIEEDWHDNK